MASGGEGDTADCVWPGLRRGKGFLPPGLPVCPPSWQPGTYLMAFFSLRPRPESGVPTVSREFL